MKILITGATGLIGKQLGKALVRRGHHLVVLSRSVQKAKIILPFPCQIEEWKDIHEAIDPETLEGVEGVIHLAGEPVAGERWSKDKKQEIRDSRIIGTQQIIQAIQKCRNPVVQFAIFASAIGFYGNQGEKLITEEQPAGSDFLAQITQAWEQATLSLPKTIRKTILRIGVVLDREGGALPKLLTPFEMGVGGKIGSGKQWMSWIHLTDLVQLITQAAEDTRYQGVFNAVAPKPVTNAEFTQILARMLRCPAFIPTPALALHALFGEMADVILASQQVLPKKALHLGFQFQYPQLEEAFTELFNHYSKSGEWRGELFIDQPIEKVFSFFCVAENLEKITPPHFQFKVVKASQNPLTAQSIIDYKLKIYGIPFHWRSRIEDWKPPYQFADRQLKGPFAELYHTHRFETLGKGTLISDHVSYKVPLGFFGKILSGAKVKKDFQQVFEYRREVLKSLLDLDKNS